MGVEARTTTTAVGTVSWSTVTSTTTTGFTTETTRSGNQAADEGVSTTTSANSVAQRTGLPEGVMMGVVAIGGSIVGGLL